MIPNVADRLIGAYPVLPTPFRDDQSVDLDGLSAIVNRLLSHGVRGLTVLGSGSEGAYLTEDEQNAVLGHVVERAAGRATVLAGLMQFATSAAVEQGRRFRDLGADALLLGLPQPYDMALVQVVSHYTAVVRDVRLPTLYYHPRKPVHVGLTPTQVGTLFAEVSLVGIKNASPHGTELRAQIRAVGRPIAMFTAQSEDCLSCLVEGGVGAMCPLAALLPKTLVGLVEGYRTGEDEVVRANHARLRDAATLVAAETPDTNAATALHWGVKEALVAAGVIGSAAVRSPQPGLTPERRARIRAGASELVEL